MKSLYHKIPFSRYMLYISIFPGGVFLFSLAFPNMQGLDIFIVFFVCFLLSRIVYIEDLLKLIIEDKQENEDRQ